MATTSLWNLLGENKIVIPILQRDYAQGRQIGKVPIIRQRFLNALDNALNEGQIPLELDFIYGYKQSQKDGGEKMLTSFVPLDGQQRLTTLFLLHWFIAVKENHSQLAQIRLSKFTYETRHSTTIFCEKLVEFQPEELQFPIAETIKDQPWFFAAWHNDPTITSMLVMLNDIQVIFGSKENVWPLLTSEEPKVVFHLLPMEKIGLPDDLYIKMNSRGKELTDFEYFKSRFSEILPARDKAVFEREIDQSWSDLFWDLYKYEENEDIAKRVDRAFLRFFSFITDMLIALREIDIVNTTDEFSTYHEVYKLQENVDFLFSSLNSFVSVYKLGTDFFSSLFYVNEDDYVDGKTRLFFQSPSIDLFSKCSDKYDASSRSNPFSIGEQLLLYACMIHLKFATNEFCERIRIVRNLITNSDDSVRKENLHALLTTVSEIIITGKINDSSKFNKTQAAEEQEKREFILANPTFKPAICQLEDHHLLQGCLAIFNLDSELTQYASAFRSIFTERCNYDNVSRAMLTFGDYTQKHSWRRRLGNHNDVTWRELFTPSQRRGDFENTKIILYCLLKHLIDTPQANIEILIETYLEEFILDVKKPKSWVYYYIKYPEFRKNEEGFYSWWPKYTKPYECIMMRRTTLGGFYWSPFLYAIKNRCGSSNLGLENYGHPLVFTKDNYSIKITNVNNGFKLEGLDDDNKNFIQGLRIQQTLDNEGIFQIAQDQNGIDIEDRVEKGKEMISILLTHQVYQVPSQMNLKSVTKK